MDKSVIIFILFALAFAAAVVGGVLFVTARRLPAQLRASRLSTAARVIDGRSGGDGTFSGTYKDKQVQLRLSPEQPLSYLHITISPVTGNDGWQLTSTASGLSLKAARAGLADTLLAAGLEARLGPLRPLPDLALTYQPQPKEQRLGSRDTAGNVVGVLECSYQLADAFAIPNREDFAAQLDALLDVAAMLRSGADLSRPVDLGAVGWVDTIGLYVTRAGSFAVLCVVGNSAAG